MSRRIAAALCGTCLAACSATQKSAPGSSASTASSSEASTDAFPWQGEPTDGDSATDGNRPDASVSLDGSTRSSDGARGRTTLDSLVGRWVGRSGEIALNRGATPSVEDNIELIVTRSGDELHGVLSEFSTDGGSMVLAEYVITLDGQSLCLVLKEVGVPYACIRGPGLRGNECRSKKARHTYRFRSTAQSLFFRWSSGPTDAFRYPIIIEFSTYEGRLEVRSAFGPQHGATLDRFQMFWRVPARDGG